MSSLLSNHKARAAASTSQTTVNPMNTFQCVFHSFQGKSMEKVQGWKDALKQINDAYKQALNAELFGDEPVCVVFF